MPHLVGLFSHPDSFDLLVSVFAVEQTKLYTRRVFRKQREVYTRSVPGGSQRIGIARPYFHREPRLSAHSVLLHASALCRALSEFSGQPEKSCVPSANHGP